MENIPKTDLSLYSCEKYKDLAFVDFDISANCCNIMKKAPAHNYAKKSGLTPITGTTAEESRLRTQQWLKNGCNGFEMKTPISNPMSFWTKQDVLQYIKENNLPIASIYGDVVYVDDKGNQYNETLFADNGKLTTTGVARSGCCYCGFGAGNPNDKRYLELKEIDRKKYDFVMGGGAYEDGLWKPNKDGLGFAHCIDKLNQLYSKKGKPFIKY